MNHWAENNWCYFWWFTIRDGEVFTLLQQPHNLLLDKLCFLTVAKWSQERWSSFSSSVVVVCLRVNFWVVYVCLAFYFLIWFPIWCPCLFGPLQIVWVPRWTSSWRASTAVPSVCDGRCRGDMLAPSPDTRLPLVSSFFKLLYYFLFHGPHHWWLSVGTLPKQTNPTKSKTALLEFGL